VILSPFTFVSITIIDNNCTCISQKMLCFISFLVIQVLKHPRDPRHLKATLQRKAGARYWIYQSKIDKAYKKDCNYTTAQQKIHDQKSLSLSWTLLCCPLLHSLDYKIIALLL